MDVELWYLPELGPFGNYTVFIWNAFEDILFQLVVYFMEDVGHAHLTYPGASPCSGEHI